MEETAPKKAPRRRRGTVARTRAERAAETRKRDHRRAKVAELAITYATKQEIADVLCVSVSTITKDLKWAKEHWRAECAVQYTELVGRELAALKRDEGDLRRKIPTLQDPVRQAKIYDRILAIQKRRAKIVGMDAADRNAIDVLRLQQVLRGVIEVIQREVKSERTLRKIANALIALPLDVARPT